MHDHRPSLPVLVFYWCVWLIDAEIIAEEASKANELRYLIEGGVARSDQRLAH